MTKKIHDFIVPVQKNGKISVEEIRAEDEHSAWVALDEKLSDKLGNPLYESMGLPRKKSTIV